MLAQATETVFVMIILIATGWIMAHRKWIDNDTKEFLNKLIVGVSIPALTIYNFFESFDRDIIKSSFKYVTIILFAMLILYLFSGLVAKLLSIGPERRGSFVSMSTVSNSMFFGLPVSLGLFGDISLPYVLFYYIANTTMFWGICSQGIINDGRGDGSGKIELKRIFNIPIITVLISAFLLYLNISPPTLIIKVSKHLSSFVTPIASIVIGKIIYDIDYREFKFDKSIFAVILMRFIFAPGLIYIVASFIGLPKLAVQVFTIQGAMPVMTQTSIVGSLHGADSEYIATAISLTTILSLVFIPIYAVLIQ